MAVGDLYSLQVGINGVGRASSVALGYRQTVGTNDSQTLQSAVDFFVTNFLTVLKNVISVDAEIGQVRMDQVTVGDEVSGIDELSGQVGAVTGAITAEGGAAVITWVTDAPNSKHNGRTYLPGVSEDEVIASVISPAQSGVNILLANKWDDDLLTSLPQTAVFERVVISRILNGAPRVPPVGFKVTSNVVRLPMYTQSRRISNYWGHN